MNNARRKLISAVVATLSKLDVEDPRSEVETIRDEEQEALDNLPDSLKEAERGQAMEEAIGLLETAMDALESMQAALGEALEALENIG